MLTVSAWSGLTPATDIFCMPARSLQRSGKESDQACLQASLLDMHNAHAALHTDDLTGTMQPLPCSLRSGALTCSMQQLVSPRSPFWLPTEAFGTSGATEIGVGWPPAEAPQPFTYEKVFWKTTG